MRTQANVFTDTATLVLFDPSLLVDRQHDVCDWWTGDGDLEREEAARNLTFVATGIDGTYELEVLVGEDCPEGKLLKQTTLATVSNELVFGPGERLPGEGVLRDRKLAGLAIVPGDYEVKVIEASARGTDALRRYCFALSKK